MHCVLVTVYKLLILSFSFTGRGERSAQAKLEGLRWTYTSRGNSSWTLCLLNSYSPSLSLSVCQSLPPPPTPTPPQPSSSWGNPVHLTECENTRPRSSACGLLMICIFVVDGNQSMVELVKFAEPCTFVSGLQGWLWVHCCQCIIHTWCSAVSKQGPVKCFYEPIW